MISAHKDSISHSKPLRGIIIFEEACELGVKSRIYVKIEIIDDKGCSNGIIRQVVIKPLSRKISSGDHIPFEISNYALNLDKKYVITVFADIYNDCRSGFVSDCSCLVDEKNNYHIVSVSKIEHSSHGFLCRNLRNCTTRR